MNNQYCRVGTVTSITNGSQAITELEIRYKNFVEKATNGANSDSDLVEFFKQKAQQIKKVLESLG